MSAGLKFLISSFCSLWLSLGAAQAAPDEVVITILGDSLSAGYQIDKKDALPSQLGNVLAKEGVNAKMINAAISGDTTTGGLSRFDWSIPDETTLLIIALGANDGMRHVPIKTITDNLDQMITKAKARNMKVVLAGMRALQNYGDAYEQAFAKIYPSLAAKHDVALVPFLLDGVVREPALNISDGIHPNALGVRIMAENLLPHVVDALR